MNHEPRPPPYPRIHSVAQSRAGTHAMSSRYPRPYTCSISSMRKPAAAASVAFHGAALLLLLSLHFYAPPSPGPRAEIRFIPLTAPPRIIAKSGGGGQRQPLPASRGQAPKPVPRQFTIPLTMVN